MKTIRFIYILTLFVSFSLSAQIQVKTITEAFNGSGGLNMGSDGMLYVADFGQSLDMSDGTQVWRIDYKNGGQPQLFASGLSGASGNDFDSEGNLFQSNIAAGRVSKITPQGSVSTFTTSGISCPVGISIDDSDNLFVCNCCSTFANTIRKVTPQGTSTQFAASSLFNCPNGITRDTEGNLYVSNFGNGNVLRINEDGQVSRIATTPGNPGVSGPGNGHITYSELENVLYVASHGSSKIYKLTLTGQLSVLAGSGIRGNRDGEALEATFSRPNGVVLSVTEDTLFVNSAIPITDFGGRPLNPSVIRMITGLRSISATDDDVPSTTILSYDQATSSLLIRQSDILNQPARVQVFDIHGRMIVDKKMEVLLKENSVSLSRSLSSGIYVVLVSVNSRVLVKDKFVMY